MKKLILIDIDGTLENDNNQITNHTINTINEVTSQNHLIVLASGRPRYYLTRINKTINTSNIIISFNGAEIYNQNNNQIIYSTYLPSKEITKICKLAEKLKTEMYINANNNEYTNKTPQNKYQIMFNQIPNKLPSNVNQIMFRHQNIKTINKLKAYIKTFPTIKIIKETTYGKTPHFSIVNKNASKGNALLYLIQYLNIKKKNTITIGNDYNDISMFKIAHESYATNNANDIVKLNAKYITQSNNNHGVAMALKYIIEKEKTP